MDHKERSDRKKDLIDAKNRDYKSRDHENHENGTKSTEGNLTDPKSDHKKGKIIFLNGFRISAFLEFYFDVFLEQP